MKPGEKVHTFERVCLPVPTDKFLVNYGYKNRWTVQVRLQKNSKTGDDEVYCGWAPEYASGILSATVPFDVFAARFKEFVKHLNAYQHLSAEKAEA